MEEKVRKIGANERSAGAPTPGMIREEAFATDGMWAGLVRTDPRMASGWHLHAGYTSAIFILKGALRMEFGPGGTESVEAGPGDFVYVPKGAVHREANPTDEPAEIVVVRAGTGDPVTNVDGPEPVHPAAGTGS